MAIYGKESMPKVLERSKDSAYKLQDPVCPIQPVMSYRWGIGSDTGYAPQPNAQFGRPLGMKKEQSCTAQDGANFWETNGTRRMKYESQDK